MCEIAWCSTIARPNCTALREPGPSIRRGRAAAAAAIIALVAEPLVRERHATLLTDQVGGGNPHVLESDDRVAIGVRVRIGRFAHSRTPGVSLSTKNIAWAPSLGPPTIFAWKKQ